MSDTNRYYLVNIIDDYYAMEFRTSVLVRATDKTIDLKVGEICSKWYSEYEPVLECEDAEGLYEQANGCVTYTDGIKEISETTYNELMNFLGAY
jgi:hypothetical protein